MENSGRVTIDMFITAILAITMKFPAAKLRAYIWHDGQFRHYKYEEAKQQNFTGSCFRIQMFHQEEWIDFFYQSNTASRGLDEMFFNFISELATGSIIRIQNSRIIH